MKVSIIIVNYNTPDITSACLKSIREYREKLSFSFEVILVDNAPKQDFFELFRSSFSSLIYLKSDENIGFGKANNLGMEVAKGDYFLLLNSDTLLIDDSINHIVNFLTSDTEKKIGLVGCKLLNDDMSYQHSFYPFTNNSLWNYFKANNPVLSKIFKTGQLFTEANQPIKVGDVSGAFMLLRAEVFKKLKGFDPDFFLYCEETEWCRNRIAKHYEIVYYPHTRIVHLGGKSAPKNTMAIQASITEYLFWYKTGVLNFLGFMLINTINLLTQVLIYPFVHQEDKRFLQFYIKKYFISLKYALFEIPKYHNKFAARPSSLYYKDASHLFFEKKII